jgi:hypothetical protein
VEGIDFDDGAADAMVKAAQSAGQTLQGQASARTDAVAAVVVDFSGAYKDAFETACRVENEDRGRLGRVFHDLADAVLDAKTLAQKERQRLKALSDWQAREDERDRLAAASPALPPQFNAHFFDPRPSTVPVARPEVSAAFSAQSRRRGPGEGGTAGTSSADPDKLRRFVSAAKGSDGALERSLSDAKTAWARFVSACAWARIGSSTFMGGGEDLLRENAADGTWLTSIAEAFERAGGRGVLGNAYLALYVGRTDVAKEAAAMGEKLKGMSADERSRCVQGADFAAWAAKNPQASKLAMDAAADGGLFPVNFKGYKSFLSNYWNNQAMAKAGIDPASWEPAKGTTANWSTVVAVYDYYGSLYLKNPDLQWAGMANMIGPSFAGGFKDLKVMVDFCAKVSKTPINLGSMDTAFYERTMLGMQKEIFHDQARMQEAYTSGGMAEIRRLNRSGAIDQKMLKAWENIDSGDPERVSLGNRALLNREQNETIADDYDEMRNHPVTGEAVTYAITAVGKATIPGTKTYAMIDPVRLPGVRWSFDQWIRHPQNPWQRTMVTTSLPAGNISVAEDRWKLIEEDTLPAFQKLLAEDPARAREIIGSDFNTRVEESRPLHTLDETALRLLLTNKSEDIK